MAAQRFSELDRIAFWLTYNRKCAYCREATPSTGFHIDHVIPEHLLHQPEQLVKVKREYGLEDDFDITADSNLVVACNSCNSRKSGKLYPPGQTMLVLKEAKTNAPKVEEARVRTLRQIENDKALAKLLTYLDLNDQKNYQRVLADLRCIEPPASSNASSNLQPTDGLQMMIGDLCAALELLRLNRLQAARSKKSPAREEEESYLARLLDETQQKARLYSPLHGVAQTRLRPSGKAQSLSILQAWTDEPDIALLRHRSYKPEAAPVQRETYDDILHAFPARVHRAALLGDPGAGKSTTLRKLAVEMAQRAHQDPKAPLPLLITLGNWTAENQPLTEFFAEAAPEIGWAAQPLGKAGRLVLLVDGLNEVPTTGRTEKAREVRKLLGALSPQTPVLISCRREDYTGELDLGIDTLTLEPLSPPRIRAAVEHWAGPEMADRFFWQLAGDEQLKGVLETWIAAGATEEQFWSAKDPRDHEAAYKKTTGQQDGLMRRHVCNPRCLMHLASNPFMLGMLFQVWASEEGELPKNRGELFGRFINRLLSREKLLVPDEAAVGQWRVTPQGELLLKGLAGLAWRMQRERTDGDFGVLTVVRRAAALESFEGDEKLLKHALDGTLLEGGDELRFRHQLLQEYFTAQALQTRLTKTGAAELWPNDRWWQRSGWEETAVLLAGFHEDDCTSVIRWLADAQPEVAAQCILESGAEIAAKDKLLTELQQAWLLRLTNVRHEPQPEARAAIGRALGRLGLDTRKGIGVVNGVPDIDWVEIPAGEFLYQEGERRKNKRFYIARYTVTNIQFQAFFDAEDGYRNDRWWKGLTNPGRDAQPPWWSEANHPRERVSWYEVMAFCAWLDSRIGGQVRLPTEQEWERAARGADGRGYPWGENYVAGFANINETWQHAKVGPHNLARTSPVGIYPEGASAEGVFDLSGNVWEWCLNEYENPDQIQPEGTEARVVRGGSWSYVRDFARAPCRYVNVPDSRYGYFGFRVVCSSPSSGH